jgi:two-component sensor histidine kinase
MTPTAGDSTLSSIEPLSERQQADVRHRFANVFQLLSALTRMRVQRTQDLETKRQLNWMLDATGVLAAMQQRLLGSDPHDLAGYLRDLAPQWTRRSAGRPIEVLVVLEPVPVREHLISALTLIANELVINALDHAFPSGRAGVVRVELRPLEDGKAELIVSDDGAGFGPAVPGRPSLGLWLIRGLADQVKGVMSTPEGEVGVTTRLEFSTQFES